MAKHTVTVVALLGLVAAGGAAYLINQRTPAGADLAAAGKVEAPKNGPGKTTDDGKLHKLDVKPGDRILMSKYAGSEVKIDGQEFVILREDDVLGIIEP